MKLSELINKHEWLLNVDSELLECITWTDEWLTKNKDDYIKVNCEELMDKFIERVKLSPIGTTLEGELITFEYLPINERIEIVDGYNGQVIDFPSLYKIELLQHLLYYYVRMDEWWEIQHDLEITKEEYKILEEAYHDTQCYIL